MNWRQYLLSPEGRVGRQQYWLMVLLTLPFILIAMYLNGGIEHEPTETPGVFVLFPILWPGLVVAIKRWHDRNKSGYWVLINLIPIVGGIWALVENGLMKGTAGDNRFGPDPVAQKS